MKIVAPSDGGEQEVIIMKNKIDKVYIVTEGSYEDYAIVAVFTNKEKANKFIDKYIYKSYYEVRIEEWSVDVPEDKWYWTFVRMDIDGKVHEIKKEVSATKLKPNPEEPDFDISHNLILYVNTSDETEAIKIAHKVREGLIKEGKWRRTP